MSVTHVQPMWFAPRDPVRAASAVARLGEGWLAAQDDAVHGGWWRNLAEHLDCVLVHVVDGDLRVRYELGPLGGWALGITDAVTLPDGRMCVSASAEDTPDTVADGPVAGSVLAILDGDDRAEVLPLPDDVASTAMHLRVETFSR